MSFSICVTIVDAITQKAECNLNVLWLLIKDAHIVGCFCYTKFNRNSLHAMHTAVKPCDFHIA